jgi:hypothetical protein
MAIMSAEQFLKGSKPTLVTPASKSSAFQAPPKKPGFLKKVATAATERFSNAGDVLNRASKSTSITDQNPLETGLQLAGQVAGFAGDVIGAGVSSATPEVVKQKALDVLKTPLGQKGLEALQGGVESYTAWATQNPRAAANLESVVNIASILPAYKGASAVATTALDTSKAVAKNTARLADNVALNTKNVGGKALAAAADVMTPIEESAITVFKQTPKEKIIKYFDQAERALIDNKEATPLELAGNEAERALKGMGEKLSEVGSQKSALTSKLGSRLGVGEMLYDAKGQLRSSMRDRLGLVFNKKGDLESAPGRAFKVSDTADLNLLKAVDEKLTSIGGSPTFQKVDDVIDFFQDQLYKRNALTAVPINSQVEGIVKKIISDLNARLKKMGGKDYIALNDEYSQIKDVYDVLNKALGADANKGASLMKQLFSPNGTMPRKLFADVKKLSGIDLVEEATLAKFAMERVGDSRQASLLQSVINGTNLPTSKSGFISKAIDTALDKIQDPLGKAVRISEKAFKKESD